MEPGQVRLAQERRLRRVTEARTRETLFAKEFGLALFRELRDIEGF